MPLNKCAALALAVLVTLTAPTRAEDTRAFIYGNSLMNHVSGSDETGMKQKRLVSALERKALRLVSVRLSRLLIH